MQLKTWLLLLLFVPCLALSQDARGNISGTVTDPQSAAITGPSVTIVNSGTNTTTRLVTNSSGYYEAPLLLPGTYSVTVEAPGFKRYGVTLAIGDRLQVDAGLEVGGTTESVTVSAEAPLLDTSSVSTGRAITHREVMDLPVVGNNVSMLTRFSPGVQVPGTTQFLVQGQPGGGSGYSAPGGVGGNEWSIDGASANGSNRRTSFMPSPDVIDEFRIETSNFDAGFGHAAGINISMSTKSGANAVHGSATYHSFNQRWNAAPFFVKKSRYEQIAAAHAAGNHALADQLADSPMLPAGHTNNYHGTISGPSTPNAVTPSRAIGPNKVIKIETFVLKNSWEVYASPSAYVAA